MNGHRMIGIICPLGGLFSRGEEIIKLSQMYGYYTAKLLRNIHSIFALRDVLECGRCDNSF